MAATNGGGMSNKLKPIIWEASFTFHPPQDGKLRTSMKVWLNQIHAGVDYAPEEVSPEHMDSHYTLARSGCGILTLVLQKDGSSIPTELKIGGVSYSLLPNNK